jgi:7-cyano-7-deazaguanine synthase
MAHPLALADAVVLLSGGLDSATVAAIARAQGYRLNALTIDYNQRHRAELACATALATRFDAVRHVVLPVDLRAFGGSALTADIAVPKGRSAAAMGADIPVTYVPARNTVFLSLALAWAEAIGAQAIFIGVNALDYSGYPDCRPEFIAAFEAMAQLATKAGIEGAPPIRIKTPLMAMTKAQIIQAGIALGLDYGATMSCYDPTPDGLHCGSCDACLLRRQGFADAGVPDPTRYAAP